MPRDGLLTRNQIVAAADEQALPVDFDRAECVDPARVPVQLADHCAGGRVPQPYRAVTAVVAGTGQQRAVAYFDCAKAADSVLPSIERMNSFTSRRVP